MRILHRTYNNVDPTIRKQIISLTLRGGSGMRDAITSSSEKEFPIFVAQKSGYVLGWAMITDQSPKPELMVYVRKGSRRKKVGTRLVTAAMKKFGSCKVYPWDSQAKFFYTSILGAGNINK